MTLPSHYSDFCVSPGAYPPRERYPRREVVYRGEDEEAVF